MMFWRDGGLGELLYELGVGCNEEVEQVEPRNGNYLLWMQELTDELDNDLDGMDPAVDFATQHLAYQLEMMALEA